MKESFEIQNIQNHNIFENKKREEETQNFLKNLEELRRNLYRRITKNKQKMFKNDNVKGCLNKEDDSSGERERKEVGESLFWVKN